MMDAEDRVAARFMRKRGKSLEQIQRYLGYPMSEVKAAVKDVVMHEPVRDIGPAIGFEENALRRMDAEDANAAFLQAITRQPMAQGQCLGR